MPRRRVRRARSPGPDRGRDPARRRELRARKSRRRQQRGPGCSSQCRESCRGGSPMPRLRASSRRSCSSSAAIWTRRQSQPGRRHGRSRPIGAHGLCCLVSRPTETIRERRWTPIGRRSRSILDRNYSQTNDNSNRRDRRNDGGDVGQIETMLEDNRPLPSAGFRGELRRRLLRRGETAPTRIRTLIAVYAGSGALLLVAAAIGVAGVGRLPHNPFWARTQPNELCRLIACASCRCRPRNSFAVSGVCLATTRPDIYPWVRRFAPRSTRGFRATGAGKESGSSTSAAAPGACCAITPMRRPWRSSTARTSMTK